MLQSKKFNFMFSLRWKSFHEFSSFKQSFTANLTDGSYEHLLYTPELSLLMLTNIYQRQELNTTLKNAFNFF